MCAYRSCHHESLCPGTQTVILGKIHDASVCMHGHAIPEIDGDSSFSWSILGHAIDSNVHTQNMHAGSGYPSSDLPSRQAEEACPEHQQQQQHHETEKLKAQPDFLEEDEHHATDEMHNAERGRAADASAQQAAAEPLSGEMPGLDPATQEQEEDAEACKIHEPGTVATEAEDPAISSSHLSNGKLLDSSRDDGADHDTVRGKDEAGAQSSSPLPTDHKPASSATISAQEARHMIHCRDFDCRFQ